jgi:hypothetical protein
MGRVALQLTEDPWQVCRQDVAELVEAGRLPPSCKAVADALAERHQEHQHHREAVLPPLTVMGPAEPGHIRAMVAVGVLKRRGAPDAG